MTLDQIVKELNRLLMEWLDLSTNFDTFFANGFEVFEGDQISKSAFDALKANARAVLKVFNDLAALKREAKALEDATYLETLRKKVAKSNLSYFEESIKQAMQVHQNLDSKIVAVCVEHMRYCQQLLDEMRALFEEYKDFEMI
jgi:hypothetical protein